jgi:phage gp36-like protein
VAYCTQSDIEERLPSVFLAELTDDTGGITVQAAPVTRAIADADSQIDSFSRGKHSLPYSPVPDSVRRWSVSLSILNLYKRRVDWVIPDAIKEDIELVKTELRALRDNKILIDDTTSDANEANMYVLRTKQSQPIFQTNSDKTGRLDRFFAPHDGLDNE